MEQSPSWAANVTSASRHSLYVTEPTIFTRPTTFRYPQPDQSNPIQWFLRIHYDIILPSTTKFSKMSLPLTFPTKILYGLLLSHTCYTSSPSHFIDLITRIIFGEQYESWSSLLFSLLHSPVTLSLLSPGVFTAILFSDILCPCSFLIVKVKVKQSRYRPGVAQRVPES